MNNDNYSDLIGQTIGVLDENGNITKDIKISKVKKRQDGAVFVIDDNDDIYDVDELNLTYKLSPEALLYMTLKENLIVDKGKEMFHSFNLETYKKAIQDFMSKMVNSGYIGKNE